MKRLDTLTCSQTTTLLTAEDLVCADGGESPQADEPGAPPDPELSSRAAAPPARPGSSRSQAAPPEAPAGADASSGVSVPAVVGMWPFCGRGRPFRCGTRPTSVGFVVIVMMC